MARLSSTGYDLWTIERWSKWLEVTPKFNSFLDSVAAAFTEVELGDGIGMLEADWIDGGVGWRGRSARRRKDERRNWKAITKTELNAYYCSFWFCDPKGKLFLLPAYLLADLRDGHDFDFASDLVRSIGNKRCVTEAAWIDGLSSSQRLALCNVFDLLKCHPGFYSRQAELSAVVARIGGVEWAGRDE